MNIRRKSQFLVVVVVVLKQVHLLVNNRKYVCVFKIFILKKNIKKSTINNRFQFNMKDKHYTIDTVLHLLTSVLGQLVCEILFF